MRRGPPAEVIVQVPAHLFERAPHRLHGGVLRRDLAVDVQRALRDLPHPVRVDDGVVLGQVPVQLLDLVLQILDLRLEGL